MTRLLLVSNFIGAHPQHSTVLVYMVNRDTVGPDTGPLNQLRAQTQALETAELFFVIKSRTPVE